MINPKLLQRNKKLISRNISFNYREPTKSDIAQLMVDIAETWVKYSTE